MRKALLLALLITLPAWPQPEFEIERGQMTMDDGVRLSTTVYRPLGDQPFPVLLEMLPYRKDDMFYLRDYPLYSYFARRGFAVLKVDVRGTGSSEGALPPREYSEREIKDALEVIRQAAELPGSNGRVGMFGISWSGFNAIQVAMRRPPALKAILAVDASDDLYQDDIHYLDGVLHFDEYRVSIDLDNGLPDSLEYRVDEQYFRDRFDREPWLFTYMRHQTDGPFWRRNSLRFDPDSIDIPVYLIGGLLDFYRDSVPRMLESVKAPVKAEIGPWNHAWPDNGEPGPNYEWRANLCRWWDHWLNDKDTGLLDTPRLAVFVRSGHGPDPDLTMTPGNWRYEDWPIARTDWQRFFPAQNEELSKEPGRGSLTLDYQPGRGTGAGLWWGEPTGNVAPDAEGALVFDSAPLTEPVEIVGLPRATLQAAVDAPAANWSVRLEDVQPDGSVALVTGANLNGSQRASRLSPSALVPGRSESFPVELHFTTWTFRPGHRIRLSVSNAQFPMSWPAAELAQTRLELGEGTWLELPVLPPAPRPVPDFLPPEPREERTDARWLEGGGWPECLTVEREGGTTRVVWKGSEAFEIGPRRISLTQTMTWETREDNPADSSFVADAERLIELPDRTLKLSVHQWVTSDTTDFDVFYHRRLSQDGELVREKIWHEKIPRRFQ